MAESDSPFPGLRIAGPEDRILAQPLEVRMDSRWVAYLNQRVLRLVKGAGGRRLSYVRLIPDPGGGWLYIAPTGRAAYGALKLRYTPTEGGARVTLRTGLLTFDLDDRKGRRWCFQVQEREIQPGVRLAALNVRETRAGE